MTNTTKPEIISRCCNRSVFWTWDSRKSGYWICNSCLNHCEVMPDTPTTKDGQTLDEILNRYATVYFQTLRFADQHSREVKNRALAEAKQAINEQLIKARIDQTNFIRNEWNKWLEWPDDDQNSQTKIKDIVAHCDLLVEELKAELNQQESEGSDEKTT